MTIPARFLPSRFFSAAACVSLLACNSPAPEARAANILDAEMAATPAAAPAVAPDDKADGTPVTIALADRRSVSLRGFKVDAKRGLSDSQCGVMIDRERIMAMGVDDTEVYTCGGLIAAGALPPGGGVQRIGLIYDVSSPNASFRTAVVLRGGGDGWRVDTTYAGRFDDSPPGRSIPALRRALR